MQSVRPNVEGGGGKDTAINNPEETVCSGFVVAASSVPIIT